jgi:predicted nucleotidyltransferase component of viral defense system
MIRPKEIQQKAREAGVRDQQIEKDYVLSWILKGIAEHDFLAKVLVFTRRARFSRNFTLKIIVFSEDLDFTLLDNSIGNEQIFRLVR